MIPEADRLAVVRDATARMTRQWEAMPADNRGPIGQYCVFWAGHTVAALAELGIRACVNGGSAHWLVGPDPGDGLGDYSFGYEFERSPETLARMLSGLLPEMHAWAVIPPEISTDGRPWIVDLTVAFLREIAEGVHGIRVYYDFPGYYWFTPEESPAWVKCYRADRAACNVAHGILAGAGIFS